MLSLSSSTSYFLYSHPVDMRCGIYSLAGLVQNGLKLNPLSGDVFVFIGKRANQMRLLQWDGDSYALYSKRPHRPIGVRSDSRVKKHLEGQLDLFPLGASCQDLQNSEELTVTEAENLNQEQDKQGEKRLKAVAGRTRMVLPDELEREEIIIDPQGDLTDYKVIGQEVTEILVMIPACFKIRKIIRRKWALKDPVNSDAKGC